MNQENSSANGFDNLGIGPQLLERIHQLGFRQPTPIQHAAIPIATAGEDVVGIAQTGSGKTLAFSIPMLQHISEKRKVGLILVPTRELAVQVEDTLKDFVGTSKLRTALIIGGVTPGAQIQRLKANPHVIVATPGRLIDLFQQKKISFGNIGVLVLDEADRMLDMGFEPQLKKILPALPKDRQTMLFSATMPEQITAIARQYMKKPLRIEIAKPGTTADKIEQEVFIVPRNDKLDLLGRLLKEYSGKVLVFSRTKYGAQKIARKLRQMGHSADEIHSNRSQNQRQSALKGFTSGRYRILVATDIAARGIDIDDIELVINFDLPDQKEDYVHRIGRTGRAGRAGKAISFAAPEQKKDVAQIQQLIDIILPIKSHTGENMESISKKASHYPTAPKQNPGRKNFSRGGGNQRRRGGNRGR